VTGFDAEMSERIKMAIKEGCAWRDRALAAEAERDAALARAAAAEALVELYQARDRIPGGRRP
jgi:hypothetical protein